MLIIDIIKKELTVTFISDSLIGSKVTRFIHVLDTSLESPKFPP